jgi:hypothetical protein
MFYPISLAATIFSALTGIITKSFNDIFLKICTHLATECKRHSPFAYKIEIDESYFGPTRILGERGR